VGNQDEPRVSSPRANRGERGQQRCLVRSPGRARHEGRCIPAEAQQRIIGPDAGHSRRCAVEPRVAQHADPLLRHAEPRQPFSVVARDGRGGAHHGVPGRQQRSSRPAEPPTSPAHRACHDRHRDPPRRGPNGELGPQVQLGEHQEIRGKAREQAVDFSGQIVRQVIGDIDGKASGQARRRGAEVGVGELAVGADPAELQQNALRLQALAHRGGMEPDERPAALAPCLPPGGEPAAGLPAAAVAGPQLGVEQPGHRAQGDPQPNRRPVAGRCGWHGGNVVAAARDVNRRHGRRGCSRTGRGDKIPSRTSCPTCNRGGDPLSTESRVACGR
jgi:hypothetical protein